MLKVVKRPKEYIAIKVPEDCEDVGKFVSNKFKENGIPIRVNVRYGDHVVTTFGERENQRFVKQGDMLVADYSEPCGYVVHAMSQEEFNKQFKPVDDPAKASPIVVDVDAKPILDRLQKIKAEMSTKIEGVALPDRTSTPHVRIEFDDINDVPHVWIDGKYISSFPDHGLVRLNLEWNADKGRIKHNHYCIEYRNGEGTNPCQYTGIGQTNETDE